VSVLLPRYYLANDEKSPFHDDLLMDYINYPTLGTHIIKAHEVMSFQSKLYFGYAIAQALRYLHHYEIAHLDVKPYNIMLYRRNLIKLIDFGEAYHPDVKSTLSPTQTTVLASPLPILPPRTTTPPPPTATRTTSSRWE
jgi:serine/threonine protein kinase